MLEPVAQDDPVDRAAIGAGAVVTKDVPPFAIVVGVLLGAFKPELGQQMQPLGDAFIKLVKMIIAPVIFLTIVTGIAGMTDKSSLGRLMSKTLLLFLVLTVISAVIFTRLPQSFFPPSSTPLFYVNLFLPQGTHIRDTARAASEVEQYLAEQDGVSDLSSFIGAGASRFMLTYMPEQPNSSLMHFLVRTEDADLIDDLVRQINQELPQRYPSADVTAAQFMFGPNAEAKLEARISGPDIQVLREISAEGRKRLQEQGQVLNVRDDWRQPVLVLRPQLALDRLADAGLTRQAVARALAAGSEGQRVSLLRERDELIPVLLRAAPVDEARLRTDFPQRFHQRDMVRWNGERRALEAQVREAGLQERVFMPGRAGNVGDWYESADLYVLTSRFEGLSNTLLESMASGLAAVAFDCDTGPREIVRDGVDGVLVRPNGDVPALVAALDALTRDDAGRARMAQAAIDVRERFSAARVLQKWQELFDGVRAPGR